MTNILQAIHTIVNNDVSDVVDFYRSQNKINAVGDALELFIKDVFANTVSETKELGRVNKVDPLGITSLRIRGMWQIEHPEKVYQYLMPKEASKYDFRLVALMRESKYQSFPQEDRKKLESIAHPKLQNQQVKIKSPDNPIKRVAARLITFQT